MSETKPCPRCSAQMILRETGMLILTYPGEYERQWWCGCGHREPGPGRRERTGEELAREEWEQAQ